MLELDDAGLMNGPLHYEQVLGLIWKKLKRLTFGGKFDLLINFSFLSI